MKRTLSFLLALFAVILFTTTPALAATTVPLIQQDFSDCQNSDVTGEGVCPGGFVDIAEMPDQSLTANVTILSGTPDTTYNFYLKCVGLLGQIQTDDSGIGNAAFPLDSLGGRTTFAFDMYPPGAPSGNKYQSVQVQL